MGRDTYGSARGMPKVTKKIKINTNNNERKIEKKGINGFAKHRVLTYDRKKAGEGIRRKMEKKKKKKRSWCCYWLIGFKCGTGRRTVILYIFVFW